jgi:hypothetical protein
VLERVTGATTPQDRPISDAEQFIAVFLRGDTPLGHLCHRQLGVVPPDSPSLPRGLGRPWDLQLVVLLPCGAIDRVKKARARREMITVGGS